MNIAICKSPFGNHGIVEEDGQITRLLWKAQHQGEMTPVLRNAVAQLSAYFEGELTKFDLPLAPAGSEFLQAVYRAMLAIPFGETRQYGEIAKDLASPAQPVGAACGSNPIPIIIPCHRVVGASSLGGFSGCGGVETKVALLRHEGAYSLLL